MGEDQAPVFCERTHGYVEESKNRRVEEAEERVSRSVKRRSVAGKRPATEVMRESQRQTTLG